MPTYKEVAELYIATFDRAPEGDGLKYWVEESGLSIEEIAQSFFDQPETQTLYPAEGDINSFIENVYQNVLDREPDAAGITYWKEQLTSGNIERADFILAIVNGAKEHEEDAKKLAAKTDVGLLFADVEIDDIRLAKEVIEDLENAGTGVEDTAKKIEQWSHEEARMEKNNSDVTLTYGVDGSTTNKAAYGSINKEDGKETSNTAGDQDMNSQSDFDSITLTQEQVQDLLYLYQEEKLAGDVYEALNDRYDNKIFENIASAEDQHQEMVASLLESAGVDFSNLENLESGEFEDESLQSLYTSLIREGSNSYEDAISVGIEIEEKDIADIQSYLSENNLSSELENLYENLLSGSQNHLEAFDAHA